MVLGNCSAKPRPSCACMFAALTVASATASVSMMSLLQAGLARRGHRWEFDWTSIYPDQGGPARMASAINASLALSVHLESIRTEVLQTQERQHREVTDAIAKISRSVHRDILQLRQDFFNFTHEQRKEISDVLLEQLKTLEEIKLRGFDREPHKKTSAIGEGLWGLLSSTVKDDREESTQKDSTTTLSPLSSTTTITLEISTQIRSSTTSSTTATSFAHESVKSSLHAVSTPTLQRRNSSDELPRELPGNDV